MSDHQTLIEQITQLLLSGLDESHRERFTSELEALDTQPLESIAQLPSPFINQWHKVAQCSQFALEQVCAKPQQLLHLAESTTQQWCAEDYQQSLNSALAADIVGGITKPGVATDKLLDKHLRTWRNAMMVRSIWRDLNRLAPTLDITAELSHMASSAIETALRYHYQMLSQIKGVPTNSIGEPQTMFVIGMGKLGAYELNLSSDIDLIFAFPESGETQYPPEQSYKATISNREFFTFLGQKLIKSLNNQTVEGFVFRVDMRLRPYGQSGALASNFDSLETYYHTQGRDWERYAMVKARIVASALPNQQVASAQLMQLLRDFTYRKYVDFTAIEALRDLKQKIRQEVKRRRLKDNVKLGEGGIREVEFIVQALQLIRGGRDTQLQTQSLEQAMQALVELDALPVDIAEQLLAHYLFLRDVEHGIQAWQDQQTQELPSDPMPQRALATALNCEDFDELLHKLEQAMTFVSEQFANVIATPEDQQQNTSEQIWQNLWAECRTEYLTPLLSEAGFENAEQSAGLLHALHNAPQVKAVDKTGAQRLNRFMPLLLKQLTNRGNASQTLARLQPFIVAIVRRSAYVLLLIENAAALEQLITLSEASPWIPERLAKYPALLDELLSPTNLYQIPNKTELAAELQYIMLRIPEEDLEQQMETLRYFRQAHGLKVAACEVTGKLPLMKVSDYLTELAEVILNYCQSLAWQQMISKHGQPGGHEGDEPHFIVVGYGKVGGIELGHSSDLDLVFIHNANTQKDTQAGDGQRALDNHTFYTRMGQKIIHLMSTNTPSGMLYEIDMRLRPNGASGMLVATIASFERYQQNDAWTWEHQALVRTRVVTGCKPLAQQFEKIRYTTLCQQRDLTQLKTDVVEMRQKMRDNLGTSKAEKAKGKFHLKQDAGGIVDIEFMVQYLVLANAHKHPELTEWTDNVRILETVEKLQLLRGKQAQKLTKAYKAFRTETHKLALQQSSNKILGKRFDGLREGVQEVWQELLTSTST